MMTQLGMEMGKEWESPCMGMGMARILMGINSHRWMQCLAYVIVTYRLRTARMDLNLTFIIYYDNLFLVTILIYLIETVRFSDKLSTMTFYVS